MKISKVKKPKYPQAKVRLIGSERNAHLLLQEAQTAMRSAGVPEPEIGVFTHAALSGDYDHLMRTLMAWVAIE